MSGTLVSQSRPRLAASVFHSSEYPFPSKRIGLEVTIYDLMILNNARSFGSPFSMSLSTSALNWNNWLATAAFSANIAAPQLAEEPTARNSKRLPVKAKGEVRLRSVLSKSISGILATPSFISFLALMIIPFSAEACSNLSNTSLICLPRKTEIIAGGASFAPRRCSFVALAMDAFSSPLYL